jgi:hypothetical protein
MKTEIQPKVFEAPTDQQINDLADWLKSLNYKQIQFLKESYEGYLVQQSQAADSVFIQ